MRALPILSCLLSLALMPAIALAQAADESPMAARLSAEKVADVEPGLYAAGDNRTFTLEPYGDRLLLQLSDSPEKFVLTVERGSLGAKVLKYDTGATALRVSVWGGLTLYTQADPSGVPATRQSDLPGEPPAMTVAAADLAAAFRDEAAHLNYVQAVALHFAAGANVQTADDAGRAAAFEALSNTGRGLERFLAAVAARKALAGRLDTVRIAAGPRPLVTLTGKVLTVSFTPELGLAGCPSSHAVAHALGKLLAVATAE